VDNAQTDEIFQIIRRQPRTSISNSQSKTFGFAEPRSRERLLNTELDRALPRPRGSPGLRSGGGPDFLNRGQQQTDQDRNDRDDDQELDERKPRTGSTRRHGESRTKIEMIA